MALVLAFMPAQAAIYMVGNHPFGNGIYTLTTSISGTVWFVFADGQASDWNVFNSTYRYGPNGNGSQEVFLDNEYTTQKSNNNHSYKFIGNGQDYTFTFNLNKLTFSIKEYVEPAMPDPFSLSLGDVNGDGEITVADVTSVINIILGGHVNYDIFKRADVNRDNELTIADISLIINYILGNSFPVQVKEGYDYVWDDEAIPEIHIKNFMHPGEQLSTGPKKLKGQMTLYESKKQHFGLLTASERRQVTCRHHGVLFFVYYKMHQRGKAFSEAMKCFISSPVNAFKWFMEYRKKINA